MFFEVAEYHFYVALSRAALRPAAHELRGTRGVGAHHRHLEEWAGNWRRISRIAPRWSAPRSRVQGRELTRERLYQEAVRSARANGYVHHEALAYETAARFYRRAAARRSPPVPAQRQRCYVSWGADGKVRQLDELHPQLRPEEPRRPGGHHRGAGRTAGPRDRLQGLEAASGEFVLDKLIDKLMRTALEHAGAQRGLLIDSREGVLQLEAQAVTSGNDIIVHRTRDPIETVGLSDRSSITSRALTKSRSSTPPSVRARFMTMSTSAPRMSARYSVCHSSGKAR